MDIVAIYRSVCLSCICVCVYPCGRDVPLLGLALVVLIASSLLLACLFVHSCKRIWLPVSRPAHLVARIMRSIHDRLYTSS